MLSIQKDKAKPSTEYALQQCAQKGRSLPYAPLRWSRVTLKTGTWEVCFQGLAPACEFTHPSSSSLISALARLVSL